MGNEGKKFAFRLAVESRKKNLGLVGSKWSDWSQAQKVYAGETDSEREQWRSSYVEAWLLFHF